VDGGLGRFLFLGKRIWRDVDGHLQPFTNLPPFTNPNLPPFTNSNHPLKILILK